HQRRESGPAETELPGDGGAQHPAQGLHERIANADRLAAMGAAPPEHEPGDERNVLQRADRRLARRAGRARHRQVEPLRRSGGQRGTRRVAAELSALLAPRAIEHHRQSIDHDVQEAAHGQTQHQAGADEHGGRGCEQLDYCTAGVDFLMKTPRGARRFRIPEPKSARQTTDPSLKIGRYMAITRLPTSTPRITMIMGSSRLDMASTALSTSAS